MRLSSWSLIFSDARGRPRGSRDIKTTFNASLGLNLQEKLHLASMYMLCVFNGRQRATFNHGLQ